MSATIDLDRIIKATSLEQKHGSNISYIWLTIRSYAHLLQDLKTQANALSQMGVVEMDRINIRKTLEKMNDWELIPTELREILWHLDTNNPTSEIYFQLVKMFDEYQESTDVTFMLSEEQKKSLRDQAF